MTHTPRGGPGPDERAVLLAAGLADLVVSAAGSVAGTVQQLLRRSDGPELARDAQQDLIARGRITVDRLAAPPAHLEVLARHAAARRAASGGDA
ncbi:polyprenyl synthetase [Streptomyces sp. NPDC049910]|nr:polyprenyl synthetase [Streptomyces spongiicola]AWK11738.1 polyprenyl synthetase [Streptomyces spongiicola]